MSAPDESAGSERPCGITSFIPLGMSCRGRAEAFARSLQSRLRTLGSQSSEADGGSNGNGTVDTDNPESTWLTQTEAQVTSLQPLRNLQSQEAAADSFFDFDMEPESPGSPIDECEYSRLIETTTHTPHPADLVAPESGYVCASPVSAEGSLGSQSSSDGPYFDPESSDAEQRSLATDYHDCIGSYKKEGVIATIFENVHNGALKMRPLTGAVNKIRPHPLNSSPNPLTNGLHAISDNSEGDSGSDSLPPSQETTTGATLTSSSSSSNGGENADKSDSTVTGLSSHSNSTLLDETEGELGQEEEDDKENVGEQDGEELVAKDRTKFAPCKEQAIDDIRQDDLDELKKFMSGQCNGHGEDESEVREQNGAEYTHHITNGHAEGGEGEEVQEEGEEDVADIDEVDRSCSGDTLENLSSEGQEIARKNERIILECLRVIDATPEASPEPESRPVQVDNDGEDGQGRLKVETGLLEDDNQDADRDLDADDRPQRVRRCSSLKTGKTPPGTPGRKKIVRFADVLGLDLAAVRTFMDEMPKIPKSAYEDLDLPDPADVSVSMGPRVEKVLMPLFQQPGALAGFLDIIRDRHVSLENAAVSDPINMTISGSVRVRNLDFHKSVYIRYSTDAWRTYSDLQANYVENSCDGFSDKFTFCVFGNALQVGGRIELAIRFHCKGQILWDNNLGANYCFQCLPVTNPNRPPPVTAPAEMESWHGASFY